MIQTAGDFVCFGAAGWPDFGPLPPGAVPGRGFCMLLARQPSRLGGFGAGDVESLGGSLGGLSGCECR